MTKDQVFLGLMLYSGAAVNPVVAPTTDSRLVQLRVWCWWRRRRLPPVAGGEEGRWDWGGEAAVVAPPGV